MKTKINIIYLLFILTLALTINKAHATSYTWKNSGGTDTSWATSNNWNPAGVPTTNDTVTIAASGAAHQPYLDTIRTVKKFTMTSGTLDLNTWNLTISTTSSFTGGTITNGKIYPTGGTVTYSGTTFNCEVNSVAGKIMLSGSTFNYVCYFEDTNTLLSIGNHSGTGNNTFNAKVTMKKNSTYQWGFSSTNGNTFNDTSLFLNIKGNELLASQGGSTKFNGIVYAGSTVTGGVQFGGTSSADTLASGKTINVDSNTGFVAGTLQFRNFTQVGNTAQSFTTTGSSTLNCISATWDGTVNFSCAHILVRFSTFNATTTLTQTSTTTGSNSAGGNTFNAATTISSTGGAIFRLGQDYDDTFNSDITVSGSVNVGGNTTTTIKGNLTCGGGDTHFNDQSSYTGTVKFSGSNSQHISSASVPTFNKIKIDKTAGSITLDTSITMDDTLTFVNGNFISTSTHLFSMKAGSTVTGASNSSFVSGPVKKTGNTAFVFPTGKNSIYRAIEMSAPSVSTNAYTAEYFDGGQSLGNTMDNTMKYIRDCGYWNLARNSGSSNVTVYLYWDSSPCGLLDSATVKVANWNGTTWKDLGNGGVTGNSSTGKVANSTTVITWGYFSLAYNKCFLTAASGSDQAFCAGDSVTIGGSPVATMGMTAYTYSWSPSTGLSSTSAANPKANPSSNTNYIVSVTDLSGCTMQDTVTITYHSRPTASAGTDQSFCDGGNVTIGGSPTANSGTSPYTYSWSPSTGLSSSTAANPTATPPSSTTYYVTVTDANGCTKKDTVVISDNSITYTWTGATSDAWETSTNWSPTGVPDLCDNVIINGAAPVVLASDKEINSIIVNSSTLTGSYVLKISHKSKFNNSVLNTVSVYIDQADTILFSASHLGWVYGIGNFSFFNQSEFDEDIFLMLDGNADTYSDGGNIFHETMYIQNHGDGDIYLANLYPDTFESNVSFSTYGDGTFYPSYGKNSTFKGTIAIVYYPFPSNGPICFGLNGGKTIFSGTAEQSILPVITGSYSDTLLLFKKLELNKDSGSLTIEIPIVITDSLIFKKGNIVSDTTNLITMNAGSIVTGTSDSSFADGPVKKIGNSAFIFPTGKQNEYRPIEISAPGLVTNVYTAEYSNDSILVNSSLRDSTLGHVIREQYWRLKRNNGTSQVYVTLSWNPQNSLQDTNITISSWDGSKWKDLGRGQFTGTNDNGTLKSSVVAASFNEFTISYQISSIFVCGGTPLYNNNSTYIKYYTFDPSGKEIYPVNLSTYAGSTTLTNGFPTTLPWITNASFPYNYVHNNNTTAASQQSSYNLNYTNNIVGIEFIFRLDENFGANRLIRFFEIGQNNGGFFSMSGSLEYPNLNFITRQDVGANGVTDEQSFSVILDGSGRKSLDYYTDGNWHHMFFKYNAVSGEKEIWVDGQLNDGFHETITGGTIQHLYHKFKLLTGDAYDKFLGSIDEVAIYTDDICDEQIYQHYLNIIGSHHYCFNTGTGCSSLPTTIPTSNLVGSYDELEYPENYIPCTVASVNDGSCRPSYGGAGIKSALDQLKSYPLPRFQSGMTLRRNVNFMSAFYMGGFGQIDISQDDAGIEGALIQEELFKNWNYYYNITESNFSQPTIDHYIALAQTSLALKENGSYAACISRPQISNNEDYGYLDCPFPPGGKSWVQTPGLYEDLCVDQSCSLCTESYWGQPEHYYYLDDGSGTFLQPNGQPVPNSERYWDYSADPDLYKRDGAVMRKHFNSWLTANSNLFTGFKIDFIAENNEISSEVATDDLAADPDVNSDFISPPSGSFPDDSWTGGNWREYFGFRKKQLDNNYRDEFFANPPDELTNTMFLNYAVDGMDDYRNLYESNRISQLPIAGKYYPTPDFYPPSPAFWRAQSVSYWHGLSWVDRGRIKELSFGDDRFAPYVAAGWDREYAELDIRPAQWLGLLKIVGMMGVDFYHTGHFKDAKSYGPSSLPPDPKGYAWQAASASYAQATLSRIEDYLTGGDLIAGNYPLDHFPSSHGYVIAGDQPNKIAAVRKLDGADKWAISATIQPLGNTLGSDGNPNSPINSVSEFNIDPTASQLTVKLPLRRQGSTYILDNSGTPILYQVDAWHEYKHPDRWSKDFNFEAEVWDAAPGNAVRTTWHTGSTYDFSNFITYVTTTSSTTTGFKYDFTPRHTDTKHYYLWVKALKVGSSPSMTVEVFQKSNNQKIGDTHIIDCSITDATNWMWYRFDSGTLDPIWFPDLNNKTYYLKIKSITDVEIDQMVLTPDKSLVLSPEPDRCNSATVAANYCLSGGDVLTISTANGNTNSSSLSSTSARIIYVTNDFTVNSGTSGTPYLWEDKVILMSPDVKIIVSGTSPLGYFKLDNCNISSDCGNMWDQITNNNVLTIDRSIIKHSQNGIINSDGSEFDITNTYFDKNYYGIQLLGTAPGSSFATSTLTGCTFRCSEGKIGKSPKTSNQAFRHVYMNDVTDFTFGATGADYENTIRNAATGVYINYTNTFAGSSTISILNSRIEREVTPFNYANATPKAIYAIAASQGTMPTCTLKVYSGNFIENWTQGIQTNLINKVYIYNNDVLDNCRNNAIFIQGAKRIDVTNNDGIHGTTAGAAIKIKDCLTFKHLEILNNIIGSSDEAIRIESNTPANGYYSKIEGNQMYQCRVGIHGRYTARLDIQNDNLYQQNISKDDLDALDPAKACYGIWLEGCTNSAIRNNTVTWNSFDGASDIELALLRGIALKSSLTGDIKENTITNMGAGIYFFGDCVGRNMLCNTMDTCFNSIYLEPNVPGNSPNTHIKDQGNASFSESWNNHWTRVTDLDKVAGDTPFPFTWVYDNTKTTAYRANPFSVSQMFEQSCSATTTGCVGTVADNTQFARQFKPVESDTLQYGEDSLLYVYYNFEGYYKMIKEDSTLLYDNTSSGSRFRSVYDSLKTTNIGLFEDIVSDMEDERPEDAIDKLNGMETENDQEYNKKFALLAYLNYYSQGLEPDSETVADLTEIAYLHPFYGGEGVYISRALLSLDIEDYLSESRLANSNTAYHENIKEKVMHKGKLYPVPANDEATFEYPMDSEENIGLEIRIHDAIGKLVNTHNIIHGKVTFSTQSYSPGIYTVKLFSGNQEIEAYKMSIVK